jgi:hypothetical protein
MYGTYDIIGLVEVVEHSGTTDYIFHVLVVTSVCLTISELVLYVPRDAIKELPDFSIWPLVRSREGNVRRYGKTQKVAELCPFVASPKLNSKQLFGIAKVCQDSVMMLLVSINKSRGIWNILSAKLLPHINVALCDFGPVAFRQYELGVRKIIHHFPVYPHERKIFESIVQVGKAADPWAIGGELVAAPIKLVNRNVQERTRTMKGLVTELLQRSSNRGCAGLVHSYAKDLSHKMSLAESYAIDRIAPTFSS